MKTKKLLAYLETLATCGEEPCMVTIDLSFKKYHALANDTRVALLLEVIQELGVFYHYFNKKRMSPLEINKLLYFFKIGYQPHEFDKSQTEVVLWFTPEDIKAQIRSIKLKDKIAKTLAALSSLLNN